MVMNDEIKLKCFEKLKRFNNYIALFAVSIEHLKNLLEKILVLLLFSVGARMKMQSYLKKKN